MASASPRLTIKNALICDQVRREDNGKLLVIGVYHGSIQVKTFPVAMEIQLLASFRANKLGDLEFEVRALDGAKELAKGTGSMNISRTGDGTVALPPMPLKVDGPTVLSFELLQYGDKWRLLASMPIEQV